MISLKPSLLIPFVIACIILGYLKAIILVGIINLGMLIVSSYRLEEPAYDLVRQLQETQTYFSNSGFYRWEGIFLILKNSVPLKITLLGVVGAFIYIKLLKNKIKNNFINQLIIITTASLTFFYNQEHAWAMMYVAVGYCIYRLKQNRHLLFPLILIIVFMWMPSLYIDIEKMGFIKYMEYHNLIRFSILMLASGLIVKSEQSPGN